MQTSEVALSDILKTAALSIKTNSLDQLPVTDMTKAKHHLEDEDQFFDIYIEDEINFDLWNDEEE